MNLKSILDAAAFVAAIPELEGPVCKAIADEIKKINDAAVQKVAKDLLAGIAAQL